MKSDVKNTTPVHPTLSSVLRTHLGVTLLAICLVGVSLTLAGVFALRAYSEHNLQLIARSISYTIEAAVVFRDAEAAAETLELIASQEELASVQVTDRDGHLLAHWQSSESHRLINLQRYVFRLLQPAPVLLPIQHDGMLVGQLELTGNGSSLALFLIKGFLLILACLLLTTLCTLYLSNRVIRGITQPLQNLAMVAHRVRYERRFDARVPSANIAELDELSQDFNELLSELEIWQARLDQENATLNHQASHDSLTGLANRTFFESRLSRIILDATQQGHCVAVLYIDGDHFKQVNDQLGHAAGDAVLIALAVRLRAQLRKDDVVARLGGDEFAAILTPLSDIKDATRIADAIQASMQAPIELPDGQSIRTTLSIGIAIFPDDAEEPHALLQAADMAMYSAKQAGRGRRHLANQPQVSI